MKKLLTVVLIAGALMVANNKANAQSKIGYVSLNEIIMSMPEAKKADSSLQQFQQALIESAKEKQAAFEEKAQKFIADSSKMTQAVKDVKRKELQTISQELAGEEQRIQQELQKRQDELTDPIQKKAMDAIQATAKENGYSYVFVKEQLIVYPPADDLAPLVKKKLGIK
ncbi:OmpH family outer membrane protein [Pinibacter soli]|uniref:OmpH family outer membrane protein n=1 Tax=Pinibacter soli TaxID=3044211 RepID=A0ABT6R7T4_9BACT|nr:OmpH family outer membrane protein [Pinibacter soli]MDI3318450.1 OmpH family outer membrane protein [Pinibacter soli]